MEALKVLDIIVQAAEAAVLAALVIVIIRRWKQ